MFRSALLILSGNAATSILLLGRNLIVARLIPVADYGVAATFAISMAVVEMMSALGLQQQIVQAREGDDPRFQAVLQGFSLLRGLIAGAALFLLAGPLASFMGIPQVAWAYEMLAIIPVLNAAQHFDIHRLNRQMRFWPMILSGGLPAMASVLMLWPLSFWFGDWRVMLWALIGQAVLATVISQLVAERPYRIGFDRAVMVGSLRFGWPLLVNGFLLFLVFNGEKLIVGREMGMAELAVLAMGITLTLTPTLVMAKSAQNFFLPQLSAALPDRFDHLARLALQVALLNGAILVLAVLLLGAPFVTLILGAKYQPLIPLLVWLAILQAFRVFKSGCAMVALARGHTANAMLANLVRVASLPFAWWWLTQGGTVLQVIWIGTLAEALGYILSLFLLRRRPGLQIRPLLPALGLTLAILGTAGMDLPGGSLVPCILFAALLATLPELRHTLMRRAFGPPKEPE